MCAAYHIRPHAAQGPHPAARSDDKDVKMPAPNRTAPLPFLVTFGQEFDCRIVAWCGTETTNVMRSINKLNAAGPRLSRDHRRQTVFVCLCLGTLLGLGTYWSSNSLLKITTRPASGAGTAQRTVNSDDDLKTGSILFVPAFGDQCRRRIIDNTTWRMFDNGVVDCDAALIEVRSRSSGSYWSSARVDVIRNGFRSGSR
jgi:hypothetical protein